MGQCRGKVFATSSMGHQVPRPEFLVDVTGVEDEIEVGGIPLTHYLHGLLRLNEQEQEMVKERVARDLADWDSTVSISQRKLSRSRTSTQVSTIWEKREANLEVLTWNVAGASVDMCFRGEAINLVSRVIGPRTDANATMKDAADVIVVGLQETISMTLDNVLQASRHGSECRKIRPGSAAWPHRVTSWVELLLEALDVADNRVDSESRGRFVLYGHPVTLFGLLLCVFCRSELVGTAINQFRTFELPVDKFETGSKGFVACRFALFHRSFCFINCHLAPTTGSGEEDNFRSLQERCEQIKKCWREIGFKLSVDELVYPASAHRTVVLFGDTNMRLNLPRERFSLKGFGDSVRQEIVDGRWAALWEFDQLRYLLSEHSALDCQKAVSRRISLPPDWGRWTEPVPHADKCTIPSFPPTFRLAIPGPGYSPKRVPAFTDRILLRSSDTLPLAYTSVRQCDVFTPPRNISDHDPVFARFSVSCVVINTSMVARLVQNMRCHKSSQCSKNSETSVTCRPSQAVTPRDTPHTADKDQLEPIAFDHLIRRSSIVSPRALNARDEERFREEVVQAFTPHIEQYAERLNAVVNTVAKSERCTGDTVRRLIEFSGECAEIISEHLGERIRLAVLAAHDSMDSEEQESAKTDVSTLDEDILGRALVAVSEELRSDIQGYGMLEGRGMTVSL
eukprot:TRINITY_DN6391_c0_g1_i1.p1 TRINITY_DN6391_c0_g1~~TRINITY_DN6391_c0_g1_i1.p1  ORF type:complete len:681 (-),score=81.49 TRINITY_DN6391_c0_g1_i1:58-2100(-)